MTYGLTRFFRGKHAQFPHDAEQAFRSTGIAPLLQPPPEFDHAQLGIPPAHVPDQLQFLRPVLVWVAVRAAGAVGQGFLRPIVPRFPEVDVRPTLVVLPARSADSVLLRVLQKGLPVAHVLCYTVHVGADTSFRMILLLLNHNRCVRLPLSFFSHCPICIVVLHYNVWSMS